MDNTMSRIGPSVRAATLRTTTASLGMGATEAERPPIDPVAATVMAMVLDVLVCVTAPVIATLLRGHEPPAPLLGHVVLLGAILTVAFTASSGGYRPGTFFRRRPQCVSVLRGGACALAVVALSVAVLVDDPD